MRKFTFLITVIMLLCMACVNEKEANTTTVQESDSGKADISVMAGGQELKIQGSCGWARAGGVNYIGAKHSQSSLRVFEVSFNIEKLPTETTTYTLTGDILDESPTKAHMTITDMSYGITEWSSFVGSGNIILKVDGKK